MDLQEGKPIANQLSVIHSIPPSPFPVPTNEDSMQIIKGNFSSMGRKLAVSKNLIYDKQRTHDILSGGARDQNAQEFENPREEQQLLSIQNVFTDVGDLEILEINNGGGIVPIIWYILTQFGGTRLEALFYGRWENKLLGVGDINIFMDVNTDFFWSVVDYLNNQKHRVS